MRGETPQWSRSRFSDEFMQVSGTCLGVPMGWSLMVLAPFARCTSTLALSPRSDHSRSGEGIGTSRTVPWANSWFRVGAEPSAARRSSSAGRTAVPGRGGRGSERPRRGAGGACDHGARGWARSAARWQRRGEQWRPRAPESWPRCWGCCCGGSADWDIPGTRVVGHHSLHRGSR